MTVRIILLSLMSVLMTLSINDIQYDNTAIMLNIIMFNVTFNLLLC